MQVDPAKLKMERGFVGSERERHMCEQLQLARCSLFFYFLKATILMHHEDIKKYFWFIQEQDVKRLPRPSRTCTTKLIQKTKKENITIDCHLQRAYICTQ